MIWHPRKGAVTDETVTAPSSCSGSDPGVGVQVQARPGPDVAQQSPIVGGQHHSGLGGLEGLGELVRQRDRQSPGGFVTYRATDISPDSSFLEMLDVVNEGLVAKGEDPIAFDHDCREGICGACGVVINGRPHGENVRTTTTPPCCDGLSRNDTESGDGAT